MPTYIGTMRVSTAVDFGQAIVRARRQRGWTQTVLAHKAGVTRVWLSAVENGKQRAEIGLVLRTLSALGLGVRIEPIATDNKAADRHRADAQFLEALLQAHTRASDATGMNAASGQATS